MNAILSSTRAGLASLLVLACAQRSIESQARAAAEEPSDAGAIRTALATLPVDSLCARVSCHVVVVDSVVRRAALPAAVTPHLQRALPVGDVILPSQLDGRSLVAGAMPERPRPDTLDVLAAILDRGGDRSEATVSLLIRGPSSQWDRLCIVEMRRVGARWELVRRRMIEG